jgi:hypothetical protein
MVRASLSVAIILPSNRASHLADNVQTPHLRNPCSTPKFLRNFVQWLRGQLPDLDAKKLLPISFECFNGGIVCGNLATPNILVAEFNRADGFFGTVPVRYGHLFVIPRRLTRQMIPVQVTSRPLQASPGHQISECHY